MDKKQFIDIAHKLRAYYPDSSIMETPDAIKLWYEHFKETEFEVLDEAVNKWVMDSKWTPTIADLKDYCEKARVRIEMRRVENIYLMGGVK